VFFSVLSKPLDNLVELVRRQALFAALLRLEALMSGAPIRFVPLKQSHS
jgi:hypothetical protein